MSFFAPCGKKEGEETPNDSDSKEEFKPLQNGRRRVIFDSENQDNIPSSTLNNTAISICDSDSDSEEVESTRANISTNSNQSHDVNEHIYNLTASVWINSTRYSDSDEEAANSKRQSDGLNKNIFNLAASHCINSTQYSYHSDSDADEQNVAQSPTFESSIVAMRNVCDEDDVDSPENEYGKLYIGGNWQELVICILCSLSVSEMIEESRIQCYSPRTRMSINGRCLTDLESDSDDGWKVVEPVEEIDINKTIEEVFAAIATEAAGLHTYIQHQAIHSSSGDNVITSDDSDEVTTDPPSNVASITIDGSDDDESKKMDRLLNSLLESLKTRPPEGQLAPTPPGLKEEFTPRQRRNLILMRWRETQGPQGGIFVTDMVRDRILSVLALTLATKKNQNKKVADDESNYFYIYYNIY